MLGVYFRDMLQCLSVNYYPTLTQTALQVVPVYSLLSREISSFKKIILLPTKPTQTIQLCLDLEAFFCHLHLKEYFHHHTEQHSDRQLPHNLLANFKNLLENSHLLTYPPLNSIRVSN